MTFSCQSFPVHHKSRSMLKLMAMESVMPPNRHGLGHKGPVNPSHGLPDQAQQAGIGTRLSISALSQSA